MLKLALQNEPCEPHLKHGVLGGEDGVTAPPATGDRGAAGVAVIPQQVLRQMLFHTEDQGAAVPLCRGQKGMRTRTASSLIKSGRPILLADICVYYMYRIG